MPEKLSRRNFLRRLRGASVIVPATVGLTASDLWAPEAKGSMERSAFRVNGPPECFDPTDIGWKVADSDVHGSSVQVEAPERVQSIRRVGWGTIIRQASGTDNWFHFAIPTPIRHFAGDDYPGRHASFIYDVYLTADLSSDTILDRVHVWQGNKKLTNFDNELFNAGLLDRQCWPVDLHFAGMAGVGLSLHINWVVAEEGSSQVTFISAGATFWVQG